MEPDRYTKVSRPARQSPADRLDTNTDPFSIDADETHRGIDPPIDNMKSYTNRANLLAPTRTDSRVPNPASQSNRALANQNQASHSSSANTTVHVAPSTATLDNLPLPLYNRPSHRATDRSEVIFDDLMIQSPNGRIVELSQETVYRYNDGNSSQLPTVLTRTHYADRMPTYVVNALPQQQQQQPHHRHARHDVEEDSTVDVASMYMTESDVTTTTIPPPISNIPQTTTIPSQQQQPTVVTRHSIFKHISIRQRSKSPTRHHPIVVAPWEANDEQQPPNASQTDISDKSAVRKSRDEKSDTSGSTLVAVPPKMNSFSRVFSNLRKSLYAADDSDSRSSDSLDARNEKRRSWRFNKNGAIAAVPKKRKSPRAVCIRRTVFGVIAGLIIVGGIVLMVLYFTNNHIKALLTNNPIYDAPYFNSTIKLSKNNFVNGTDWLGFGTSLAWWARFAGEDLNGTTSFDDLLDLFFDKDKGLGLTVVRYNLGATQPSPPTNVASYHSFSDMPAVQQYYQGPYNWDLDKGQRLTFLAAIKRGVIAAELFTSSPPWWMTYSGSSMGNTDGSDNLIPGNYGIFADYLANAILFYRDNYNISFMSVAPFTEPTANWWAYNANANQEGCHFDASSVVNFVNTLNTTLKSYGLTTQIASPDEVAYSYTQATLQTVSTKNMASFQKVNTHGYFDPPNSERAALGQYVQKIGKKVWMSELGTGGQTMVPAATGIRSLGGIGLARQIVADIYYLGVTAWVYWQALDTGGDWGLLSIPQTGYTTTYFQSGIPTPGKQYYVMMQYSRWLRPGMDIIASDQGTDVAVIAARSTSNHQIVIVALNQWPFQRVFGVDLSLYAYGVNATQTTNMTITAYRTSNSENHAQVPPPGYGSNSVVSVSCTPYSVTTVVLNGLAWTS
ncbi:hypothetical protein SmJEL517_g04342 [Synchytrium microbalum]|uniref:Endo-beta-1,6-galactanase-like domain-containing protein n=1 Tax=Synchytrium microbalum TaxID=1806994 RepID=A0A507BZG7_9FUNG|nr:uncharacterized protein SmJEL517_g04342 [Synchytrium microbalum]TPX32521.1 hypothetical protein SmJEL517_g04342 [Synchytrium microbalum]